MLKEIIYQLENLPENAYANSLAIDAQKPLIAVISANNNASLTANYNEIESLVCEGITMAGGNAKVMYVPSVETLSQQGKYTMKYDLPSRDLTAQNIEFLCSNNYYDGVVFIADSPNIIAGMLIGAIRVNIPCMFVCGGIMSTFDYADVECGASHFYEEITRIKSGKTNYEMLYDIETLLPGALGNDCNSYSANSMSCILEAIGLAVRDNGTATAFTVERKNIARETGKEAVRVATERLLPRKVITLQQLCNATIVDTACGGSSTTLLNLQAIAKELGIKQYNTDLIEDITRTTPSIVARADGKSIITQLHKAGGIYAVMKKLLDGKLLRGDIIIPTDKSLSTQISSAKIDDNIIFATNKPPLNTTHIRLIRGNVAEKGAIMRYGKTSSFTGKAKVYQNEEMAIDAILHREITEGTVVVIHNEGPKSCPGMREISASLSLLKGLELDTKVAVITDGRISDNYNGIVVGHITPETEAQELFALLRDGDEIEISASKGKINCEIKAKDLAQRLREYQSSSTSMGNVFLRSWTKNVSDAMEGCISKSK